jgi:hypothetical protein
MLGEEVVPVLRKEFAKDRPAQVPDALTHVSLRAAHARRPLRRRQEGRTDDRHLRRAQRGRVSV